MKTIIVTFIIFILLIGCRSVTYREYYEGIEVTREDGQVHGALKLEQITSEFTLGTGSMDNGERNYLPINVGNVN